jgi:phospholipid/cholesterol/gamma-HCH transport system ATP-binding protein
VIHLSGVSKSFDGRWIFRAVDLRVHRGGSAAIVGPSGAGKTVLLKTIAGLHAPDEGSVAIDSREVGMLFQRNALFNSLSVIDNLLFPLKERKRKSGNEALALARQHLEWVGLAGTEHFSPDELSGGMQKRLGIARALIVEPEVVLYDDPTAGLDPITSRVIAELIRNLQARQKTTVIAVTNDMHRAYQLGDRIYLLAQGRIVGGGTAEEVRRTTDPALYQFVNGLQEGPLR